MSCMVGRLCLTGGGRGVTVDSSISRLKSLKRFLNSLVDGVDCSCCCPLIGVCCATIGGGGFGLEKEGLGIVAGDWFSNKECRRPGPSKTSLLETVTVGLGGSTILLS